MWLIFYIRGYQTLGVLFWEVSDFCPSSQMHRVEQTEQYVCICYIQNARQSPPLAQGHKIAAKHSLGKNLLPSTYRITEVTRVFDVVSYTTKW